MILAGLIAEEIVFGERDLLELPEVQRRWLDLVVGGNQTAVVPHLEVLAFDAFVERRFVVRPLVPCVTSLP